VIGLEDLLEEDSNIASLITPILGFNSLVLETMGALEYKVEKFPQSNKQSIDFIELAGKYYKVLPLFFWWVSSGSQENCDVSLRSLRSFSALRSSKASAANTAR